MIDLRQVEKLSTFKQWCLIFSLFAFIVLYWLVELGSYVSKIFRKIKLEIKYYIWWFRNRKSWKNWK